MDWMICVDFKRFQVPRIPIEYRHGYLDYRRYPWHTRLNIDMVTCLLDIQPPGHGVLVCTNASTKHNKNDNTRLWKRVLDWVYFKADLTEHACISLIIINRYVSSQKLTSSCCLVNYLTSCQIDYLSCGKNYEIYLVLASSRRNCKNIPLVPESYVFGPYDPTDRAARAAKPRHMTRAAR